MLSGYRLLYVAVGRSRIFAQGASHAMDQFWTGLTGGERSHATETLDPIVAIRAGYRSRFDFNA